MYYNKFIRGGSMKFKEVFKKSIAIQLRDMGFRIMDAKVNFKHPKFVIYYFEDTKEFRQAFSKFK